MHLDPAVLELGAGAATDLVGPECGEEKDRVGEEGELHGRDSSAAGRLLPELLRTDDLSAERDTLDTDELHPFDVSHDRGAHGRDAHRSGTAGVRAG
jgi:hypothetical protein